MSQAKQRKANEDWDAGRVQRLERMVRHGFTNKEIAERMGYASGAVVNGIVQRLRKSGVADLPFQRVRRGLRSPLNRAAEARGVSRSLLEAQVRDALEEGGVSLIDNVLDDGVTTPVVSS